MCGLFGAVSSNSLTRDRCETALNTLVHRGPDQCGAWVTDGVFQGHRRLSILDLSEAGKQPMVDPESRAVISINGEIYNHILLRRQLETKYAFRSQSDSEVILYGYIEWGIEGLLARIEGMFAFIVHDLVAGKIFLVRDRVGIKPLYYGQLAGEFAWGSELKALRSFWQDKLQLDLTAAYDFLTYRYVPTPKTIYKNINKLPPAHYLEFDCATRSTRLQRYWQLEPSQTPVDTVAAAAQARELTSASVAGQLMSDVPSGLFLSGGMDSSVVTAEAIRRQPGLQTFCIGFKGSPKDESGDAAMAAQHLGAAHNSQDFDIKHMDELISVLPSLYDEPFADNSAIPTLQLCRFARESVTMALSGDGGDEVFGGYKWYADPNKVPLLKKFYRTITERGTGTQDAALAGLIHTSRLSPKDKTYYRQRWGIPTDYDDYWHFREHYRTDLPVRTRLQYLDFHTFLPDDVLTKVDRASMAVSMEVRVPLLATELIEFAFALPEDVRYAGGELKGLLKQAYRPDLPPALLAKKKQGFGMPSKNINKGSKQIGRSNHWTERVLNVFHPELLPGFDSV